VGGGRAPRGSRFGGKRLPCPFSAGTSCPPGAMLGSGPTCGFIPLPRWARGLCRYIQVGVPPARVSRPLTSHKSIISPSPSGGRGIRPGPDSWDRGLRTLPVLLRVWGLHVPRKAEELSGSPRGPSLLWEVRGRHV
jgi:hypothetical protein